MKTESEGKPFRRLQPHPRARNVQPCGLKYRTFAPFFFCDFSVNQTGPSLGGVALPLNLTVINNGDRGYRPLPSPPR